MSRGVVSVAFGLVFAAPAAAEPVVFSFSGFLSGGAAEVNVSGGTAEVSVAETPVLPTVGHFAAGTKVSGRLVYEAGAPLMDSGGWGRNKMVQGPGVLKSGDATIGEGAAATTIRYEGLSPDLTPEEAAMWAPYEAAVHLFTDTPPEANFNYEEVVFRLGGGYTWDEQGEPVIWSVFSETNDATGDFRPVALSLHMFGAGYTYGPEPYEPVGIGDLEVLPGHFSDFFAASFPVLNLSFASRLGLGVLEFELTSASFAPFSDSDEDVPEPGAAGLLGLAVLMLVRRARRPRSR